MVDAAADGCAGRGISHPARAGYGWRWANRTNVLICASGTPGPSPPGREAHATNGVPPAAPAGAIPGAVSEAFSGDETTSAGPNVGPSRTEASTCPLVSEPGARRPQLTIAAVPLLAPPSPAAASPGADSGCGAPQPASMPMKETFTRRPAPARAARAPG